MIHNAWEIHAEALYNTFFFDAIPSIFEIFETF